MYNINQQTMCNLVNFDSIPFAKYRHLKKIFFFFFGTHCVLVMLVTTITTIFTYWSLRAVLLSHSIH